MSDISTRLVERASNLVSRRHGRREVLRKAAMAGTALAVAPTAFALERTTAYAAVCGCSGQTCPCGSQCCDGYTEFCCTIIGRNACPPGTLLGGWWKVDGSNFCGGAARYYLDCNAQCGSCGCGGSGLCAGSCSGTPCGCANGNCGNRKAGCTRFRYGQCHNEVACLGPIVCRVVSCVPPWQLDATCSTAALVDNGTRFHNAPCLQGEPLGSIDSVTAVQGGYRVVGWVMDPDATGPIDVHVYANGVGTNLGPTNVARPDVASRFPNVTWPIGFDRIVTAIGAGASTSVCVFGINVGGGANRLLGCRSVNADPRRALDVVERVPGGVRVSGWAYDPDSAGPIDVHVYLNAQGTDLGPANRGRADVAAALGLPNNQVGFDAVIPWTGTGALDVNVFAINRGPGQNVRIGGATFSTPNAPVGSLDVAARGPGGIRVAGWAWDPETADPVQLQVVIGSQTVSIGATRRARPDIDARYPGTPQNPGFDVVVPYTQPGSVPVCVYALDPQGGPSRLLGCRTVGVSNDPIGNVDTVQRTGGTLRVEGWALDPDVPGPVPVHVYVNGQGTVVEPTNLPRPDIAAGFPGYGPEHGFVATVPVPATGRLVVDVYAIGVGPGNRNPLLRRINVA